MSKTAFAIGIAALGSALPGQNVAGGGGQTPERAVETVLVRFVEPTGPGCIVGTSFQGRRMYVSRGLASVEWKQPITSDTVFDIASNSKQFTAALVYQLVEEGPRSAQAGGRLPA